MSELPGPDVYREVLESLPHGIYIVDRHRVVQLWNDGAERITGYLRHEVIGRSCQECLLLYCDGDDNVMCGGSCPLSATMRDGKARETDLFLRHKDGSRVPVRVHSTPVRDADGVIIGVAASVDERVALPECEVHMHSRAVRDSVDNDTGIPDRESVRCHLDAVLEDFREDEFPFSVLGIKVDKVEELRQSHGVKALEAVVRVVARTLAKNLHPPDMVGHWAEDQFVVVLTNCPGSALMKVAGMLKRIIGLVTIPWWGDRVTVTVSIGGTAGHPDDTAETLVERAERALANAVEQGGGQVVIL
jgi:PAS domain S-box-containing protein/diguanylate cyclase (GGDEF)-like protein